MVGLLITVMALLVLVYSLLAKGLTHANITAPMLSLIAGTALFAATDSAVHTPTLHVVAELTLVIVLFHDASTVQLSQLRRHFGDELRLLLIGFPLALAATFVLALELLPVLGVAGALLLAAAVTPTDAGLAASTVLNPAVPVRVRRALNVESGLNDGLATPIVLLALSVLVAEENEAEPSILQVGLAPVLFAVVCSVAVAVACAWLMDRSRDRGLSGARGRAIATLVLPLLLFGLAEVIGANAFISAFVGGLAFGASSVTLHEVHETAQLLEVASDLLGFVVWFFAGAFIVQIVERGFQWQWPVLAVAVLTLLRFVPVAIAMLGSGHSKQTVAFFGWFGPRGLATIVFGLMTLEQLGRDSPVITALGGVMMCTVVLSVVAHGISASPLARWYGQWAARTHPAIEAHRIVEPRPARGRVGH